MLVNKKEYEPEISGKNQNRISSLYTKAAKIYIGKEDGELECHRDSMLYKYKAFSERFDVLENEKVKEHITAMCIQNQDTSIDMVYLGSGKDIKVLRVRPDGPTFDTAGKDFANGYEISEETLRSTVHPYIINSISLSNTENFLVSSDFLRINLWIPERMENGYNILDLKSQITATNTIFVINTCKFSPHQEEIFGYSTSDGYIVFHDINISPKTQEILRLRQEEEIGIRSVTDFCFVDENLIAGRSLNTIEIFDCRNPKRSIESIRLITNLQEQRPMHTTEVIYQTFKLSCSGKSIYTGSYLNNIYGIDVDTYEKKEFQINEKRIFSEFSQVKFVAPIEDGVLCATQHKLVYLQNEDFMIEEG